MVEAISVNVIDVPRADFFGKQIILIHPDAKYVVVCGEIDPEEVEEIGRLLGEWYENPDSRFAILMGDYMLVRVDKLPPSIADSLGISI
jgi:hypothetical protein